MIACGVCVFANGFASVCACVRLFVGVVACWRGCWFVRVFMFWV